MTATDAIDVNKRSRNSF